jgi:hypothetical protein
VIVDKPVFDPTETQLLGVVKHVQGEPGSPQFCRIEPTHRQQNNAWIPIGHTGEVFPDIGLVFWWRPDTNINKGDALRFFVEDHNNYEKGQRRDRYQVKFGTSTVPIEISNVPRDFDLATIRRRVANGELAALLPSFGYVLIALPVVPPRWIGLFKAKREEDNPEAHTLVCEVSSGFVRTFEISSEDFQTIQVDGQERLVLRPELDLPAPVGYFNVQNDADLVRALANLVRRDLSVADAQMFRKRVVDQSVAILSAEGGEGRDRPRDEARLEAARALGDDLDANEHELKEIETIFESLPMAQKALTQAKAKLEAQCVEELTRYREEAAAAISLEREKANRELAEAMKTTSSLRSQAEDSIVEAKNALETLVKNTAGKIAEHAVMRQIFESRKSTTESNLKTVESANPPSTLVSVEEINDRIVSLASAGGEDPYVARVLIGIMAGSQLTLLAGVRAASLARTVAYSIGGAASCIVPIAPTMFSLADMLNAPTTPIAGVACPGETLGQFLLQVMQQDRLSIVVLQGANRAPPENVLLELAEQALGESSKRSLRWGTTKGEVDGVVLDGRVLFLATLTEGSSTFRLPRELGTRLPLLWADRRVMPRRKAGSSQALPNASVPFDVWTARDQLKLSGQPASLDRLLSLPSYLTIEATILKYLSNVSCIVGEEEGVAEGIWALCCGRVDDEDLNEIVSLFSENQARLFRSALDARVSSRLSYYFEEGRAQ